VPKQNLDKIKGRENPTFSNSSLLSVPVHPWSKTAKMNYLSASLKLISSHLAGLVVTDQFEADLLTVIEAAHTSALNGRDVYEYIC
jgi:hypothetical protein